MNTPAHVPTQTELIITQSFHEATILGTAGCEPFQIARGPEVTQQGVKKVRWIYKGSPVADEVIAHWRNPNMPNFDWKALSRREKEIAIRFVSDFASNLRHYLAHTKEK